MLRDGHKTQGMALNLRERYHEESLEFLGQVVRITGLIYVCWDQGRIEAVRAHPFNQEPGIF
jgi:hypothetical protein